MRRSLLAVAPCFAVAVLLAGCGSDKADDQSAPTTTTAAGTSTSTTGSTSSTGGGSPGTTAGTTSTTAAGAACRTDELTASLGASDAGAGQLYAPLVLRNSGSRSCTVRGFPGVSLLDGSGNQLGDPASREGPEGGEVNLAPGAAASATLHTTNAGIGGGACTPESAQLKVYPPDQTAALVVPARFTACDGFTVTTLVAGESGTS